MEAACYSMDLYCDHDDCPNQIRGGRTYFESFTGQKRGECVRAARRCGWIFHKDGRHTCPDCRARTLPPVEETSQ